MSSRDFGSSSCKGEEAALNWWGGLQVVFVPGVFREVGDEREERKRCGI